MSYNLTEKQKDILRYFVRAIRESRLSEEFFLAIAFGTGHEITEEGDFSDAPKMSKADLLALEKYDFIHLDEKKYSYYCSLYQAGYDAVDADFVEPRQNINTQINITVGKNYGTVTGLENNQGD